jgi:glycosyltransferase involved in cell wall biosynthesis
VGRPKVAVLHPRLRFGGSEAAALWSIEALKGDYDVTLITLGKVDFERLNQYHGTRLQAGEFPVLLAPQPLGLARSERFAGLHSAFFDRFCRRVASQFDLLINTYGAPGGWATPTIQLIADFAFVQAWRFELNPELRDHRPWWYGDTPVRKAYLALCRAIAPPSPNAWAGSLVLANSHWTAQMLHRRLGIEAGVLYPPVSGSFPQIPQEERENGFVWVGRVVPEKRVEAAIEILERVRERGHEVHLHILGGLDGSAYGRKIAELCRQNAAWIFPEGYVAGERKKLLMAGHRFGIHSRANEPFGIAPAEMVKAGCIVFAPNGGGQVEIINHPALIYEDEEDAVKKIEAVLAAPALQESLRSHLAQGAERFSIPTFTSQIREFVFQVLREKA